MPVRALLDRVRVELHVLLVLEQAPDQLLETVFAEVTRAERLDEERRLLAVTGELAEDERDAQILRLIAEPAPHAQVVAQRRRHPAVPDALLRAFDVHREVDARWSRTAHRGLPYRALPGRRNWSPRDEISAKRLAGSAATQTSGASLLPSGRAVSSRPS